MLRRILSIIILSIYFVSTLIGSVKCVHAHTHPVSIIAAAPLQPYHPPLLKGLQIYPDQPFKFDFIFNIGDQNLNPDEMLVEANNLITYFLTALTIPEKDQWVNLSPYEKNRIIPHFFGMTAMGQDLLLQDYLLKQTTAALTDPQSLHGRKLWHNIYAQLYEDHGDISAAIDVFSKIWIVPHTAKIYEDGQKSYIVSSQLDVLMEEDLHAATDSESAAKTVRRSSVTTEAIKASILPMIRSYVNESYDFSKLRQIYHSMILASWYKQFFMNTVIDDIYIEQNKIDGIQSKNDQDKEKIFQDYIKNFRNGVYQRVIEQYDPLQQSVVVNRVFSGGISNFNVSSILEKTDDQSQLNTADDSSTKDYLVKASGQTMENRPASSRSGTATPYGVFEHILNNQAAISIETIAEGMDKSRRSIQEAINRLLEWGLIAQDANQYNLTEAAKSKSNELLASLNSYRRNFSNERKSQFKSQIQAIISIQAIKPVSALISLPSDSPFILKVETTGRTTSSSENITPDFLRVIESVLEELSWYWPRDVLKEIVINPQSEQDYEQIHLDKQQIFLGRNAFENEDLLKLSFMRGIVELQIRSHIRALRDNRPMDYQDLYNNKLDRLNSHSTYNLDTTLRDFHNYNIDFPDTIIDVIVVLNWLEAIPYVLDESTMYDGINNLYDKRFAEFVHEYLNTEPIVQTLAAVDWLLGINDEQIDMFRYVLPSVLQRVPQETTPLSAKDFVSFREKYIQDKNDFLKELKNKSIYPIGQLNSFNQLWMMYLTYSDFNVDEFNQNIEFEKFFRSFDLIQFIRVHKNKFPTADFSSLHRLMNLVGKDNLKILQKWFGNAFFMDLPKMNEDFFNWIEKFDSRTAMSLLRIGWTDSWFFEQDFGRRSDFLAHFYDDNNLMVWVQRNPQRYLDTLNAINSMLINEDFLQMFPEVSDASLKGVVQRDPLKAIERINFLYSFFSFVGDKNYHGEIVYYYDNYSASDEDKPLGYADNLTFDQEAYANAEATLEVFFDKQTLQQMAERDPFLIIELKFMVGGGFLNQANLKALREAFEKSAIDIQVLSAGDLSRLAKTIVILANTDVEFIKFVSFKAFLEVIQNDGYKFIEDFVDIGFISSHKSLIYDIEKSFQNSSELWKLAQESFFGATVSELRDQLDWATAPILADLIVHNRDVLFWLMKFKKSDLGSKYLKKLDQVFDPDELYAFLQDNMDELDQMVNLRGQQVHIIEQLEEVPNKLLILKNYFGAELFEILMMRHKIFMNLDLFNDFERTQKDEITDLAEHLFSDGHDGQLQWIAKSLIENFQWREEKLSPQERMIYAAFGVTPKASKRSMNFSQIKAIITDTNSSYWRSVDENDKKQKWQQAIRLGLKNSLVDMSSELSEESFPKYAFLGRLSEKVVYKLLTKQPKVFVNLLKVLRHYDEDFFKNVLGLSLEQAVQQSPNAVVRVLSDKKFHETSSLKQLKEALQNRKIGETKLIDVVKGSITNAEIVITELLNLDNDEDFSKHFSSKLWHDRKLVDIQELNAALPIEKVLEDLIRYHDMRKVSGFDQYDYFKLLEETLSRLHIKVKYKQRQSKGPWFDEAVVAPLYEHPSFREDLMELLNQHDSSPRLKQLLLTIVGHIPGLIKNDHLSKDQAIEAVVRAQFSTIKNSFSDKFYLNNLMSYFVLELINDVVPVSLSQRSRLKNMYRSFPYSLQNFDALTMHSIKSILQSQGFDLNDDEAIVDSLPLDLLSEMIIYVLDNINTSEDVRETITLFLKSHQPLYDYITAAIETKINETTLKDERYLKRLRLLILVPERASLQITKWMSGIKDKENQRRLQADVVNAYLENHLNDILIGHADLILHQPEGQGLIPIKEKLPDRAQQEFISLQGLQRDLQILGIDLSIELLPNFLNSKRFLTWAGMILPRLDIHQNMYRGSLVREDDKDAKYVTFHPPVALRYARHGGEAAKAKGRKGIHQLDMNLISENMVSLPISEEAMIEFKHNNLDMVAFFYDEKVYIMTQKQYDKFSLTGGISFFAGIIRFPNSTSGFVEVPDGDGIRLLRIGTDQSFQVQRLDDTIYIRKIDNFVALAFSFLDSFEESSYVRSLVSEGRSDLDTIRELMDLQSHERFLKEELMFAIDVIDASDDSLYLRWAINMIESVLNDMNPNRESKQFQAVDIRYRPQYFEFMYAMLQTAIDKIQERIINADQNGVDINWQNIKSVIRNNSNVKRLLATIKKYEGGIESYDRQLMLNPYQGMITNRRSEANWLLRKLSQSAPVKSDLQLLYDHGYLDFILPEFTDTRGVVQNSFHRGHTVDEHTFNVLQNIDELLMEPSNQDVAPDMLRVLGLFHDLGKVSQEPQHDRRSAEALVKFLSAAQMPKALQDRLADILVHHRHLGNIAASRVRRSSEEKANPSFKIFEQARIIKIIESFSKNRTSEQVLVDLKLNYLLTIADTKAIPYEKSDTGSRYSHIYAQELKFVYDRVLEHLESEISLRSLDFILPEDMKFSLKTRINPFSYGQTIGEAVIHLEQQFTYTSLDLLQNPNIEFVMSGRVLGQKDLDQPISLGVPLEIRYKTTVAPGGIIMSSDYLKMDGLKGKLFGNRDKAHEDIYTEVWMNQSVGLEYGTDLVGVGGVVHQIIPTTVKSFFGY